MNQLSNKALSRRQALGAIAGAGGVLALSAIAQAQDKPALTAQDPAPTSDAKMDAKADSMKMAGPSGGDLDIVRFALTMERLEAAFYAQVVAAHTERAYLPERSIALTREIAAAEADHVQALEGVLGTAGVAVPAAPTFQFPRDVFVSPIAYAWFAYTLEEIGIGAYLGAVGSIQNDGLRRSAAAIYGAEARHAALLRTFAGFEFAPRYYESPLTVEQVTGLITPYIIA